MKLALSSILFFAALAGPAQTNPPAATNHVTIAASSPVPAANTGTNYGLALAQRVEDMRATCIQNRRLLCGKILKVLPDGLVIDSGYTNLMREPLNKSWLIPGTVVAERATNLVEANQPDAICLGLVFLTDLPKSPGAKPRLYDYVNVEGFPMGQYTYTSVGDLRRTVRKFTTKLANSVRWNFEQSVNSRTPAQ